MALREAEQRLADEGSSRERAEQQREQTHQQELRRLQQRCQDLEAEKDNAQEMGVRVLISVSFIVLSYYRRVPPLSKI
jgi:hypothetical protein